MRIGIFGGSFNPVHNGHLKLAREAMAELGLDRVVFVPSYRPPLKKNGFLLPAALRVRLLRAALKGSKGFSVSLGEIRRKGVSYTVDTLKVFHRSLGGKAVLYFLSGADTLKNISRWRSLKEIFKLCRFVVMTRPGYRLDVVPEGVLALPMAALPISGSRIRELLIKGKSVRALVPPGAEPLVKAYFNSINHKGRSRRSTLIRK
ncbi:MAG: nicotinate (nicotinamide) nucleotide adenylyltransferase [Candidatus Omnitrophica bacterium]|nr:nicotinate (nicotinamide) nucleotide adenylyltransferase [Candidatus Omnitrophota bacterium]